MAEMKHTPGPWEVHEIADGPIGGNEVISRGVRSTVTGKGINTGEDYEMFSEADAHLIAAAPDLLAACKNVVAQFEAIQTRQYELLVLGQSLDSAARNWDEATLGLSVDFEPLMKAIAKAEGRS